MTVEISVMHVSIVAQSHYGASAGSVKYSYSAQKLMINGKESSLQRYQVKSYVSILGSL